MNCFFWKIILLLIPLQISGVLIRIHEGFVDFEHENVKLSDEFVPHQPYTFEISFNETKTKDYMISKCFLNNYQFLTHFGCLNCNSFIIRSIESDSYNRTGAMKQTLVYFYAPSKHITFTCELIVINCSGCAERSCERGTSLTMYQTVMLPIVCSGLNGRFICDLKRKDNVLTPHIAVNPFLIPLGGMTTISPFRAPSGISAVSSQESSFGAFFRRYSWVFILLLILLIVLLTLCCFLCYLRKGLRVSKKNGRELDYATYRHMQDEQRKQVLTNAVRQDEEYRKNSLLLSKLDVSTSEIRNAQTVVQNNAKKSVGTQSDKQPTNNMAFDNLIITEHMEHHIDSTNNNRKENSPVFKKETSSANHFPRNNYMPHQSIGSTTRSNEIPDHLRYRQNYSETPIFATQNSQQSFNSRQTVHADEYHLPYESTIPPPAPRHGLVRPVEAFDEVVTTKNIENDRSTSYVRSEGVHTHQINVHRKEVILETDSSSSSESIDVQNEREEEVKKAIYAQTFF
ncbi:unnamed protein product [Auanema sp. JU1783]|nr:unnamed protein product [Auanema sp. JU1783]